MEHEAEINKPLTLNDYQAFTESLAMYNENVYMMVGEDRIAERMGYLYPTLAFAEEMGETLGKIAKYVRKSATGTDPMALRRLVKDELGDALYQLSELSRQFGFSLEEIANRNIEKLTDRQERGVLVGEGDNR